MGDAPAVENFLSLPASERKLVEAVQGGGRCDFYPPGVGDFGGDAGDTTGWGNDRRIRATVLKAILSGAAEADWGIGNRPAKIDLRGAVVSGDLRGFEGRRIPPILFTQCRFDGDVDFSGATFTGSAWFGGSIFESATFGGTIFTGDASFDNAIFDGDASFDKALFTGDAGFIDATFTSDTSFHKATFIGDASFYDAIFTGELMRDYLEVTTGEPRPSDASFGDAIFTGTAGFDGATFTANASFHKATFIGKAGFDKTTFAANVGFHTATFTDKSSFKDATFAGDASFDEATVTGDTNFERALARRLSFAGAVFSIPEPGPWIALAVSLDRAVLAVRSRIFITASQIDARWLQAREGAHLLLRCPRVDLSDSEFLRRSIVSSDSAQEIPVRNAPKAASGDSPRERARAQAAKAVKKLSDDLEAAFAEWKISSLGVNLARKMQDWREETRRDLDGTPRSGVTSLERANIGELVLSDVVLDHCKFVGAHGLDKLRIGPGCSFQPTPRQLGRRLLGRRRIIAEELQWRSKHTAGGKPGKEKFKFLPAPDIAEIYRDLRKGLEEAKNEPGAADFYYGEMEMRRLAGRKPAGGAPRRRMAPIWAERTLLNGYWAVSGYGLRASRALITLVIVVTGSAMLYTSPTFATMVTPPPRIAMIDPTTGVVTDTKTPPTSAPKFWDALEYSARESISLLQSRGTSTITTTGAGTILDFVLRLAGPVLLAFTVLALRARIRR
jgi:uncharacterized protein YjbI with pentapeptide repeats